jgi:hypothetical protein
MAVVMVGGSRDGGAMGRHIGGKMIYFIAFIRS